MNESRSRSGNLHTIPLLVVAGATATGKSEAALLLAERLDGEILSADSAQVYVGLDIGTAKASREEQARVPHHLIDLVPPTRAFSLADYLREAKALLPRVSGSQKLPILVGGTGLYIRALTEGYRLPQAAPDPEKRQMWQEMVEQNGVRALYRELQQRSPKWAEIVDPDNPRRIMRALEQWENGEREFTILEDRGIEDEDLPKLNVYKIFLDRPREELYRRIEQRFHGHLQRGLLDEVQGVLDDGCPPDAPGLQVLAYRQAVQHLSGELTKDEFVEEVLRRTRHFAKRQYTWFRREPRLEWLYVEAGTTPAATAGEIEKRLRQAKAGERAWEPYFKM